MRTKALITDFLHISAGSLLVALGLNCFLAPLYLSIGGVSALCTIFLHVAGIPLSVTNLTMNLILFALGFRYLGKLALIKTLMGIAALSFFLQVTAGLPLLTEDLFLATITGGALVGMGIGVVLRREGSTGGSDLAALILHRLFPYLSVTVWLLIVDFMIIVVSGLVFRSLSVTFYSTLSLTVAAKLADMVLSLGTHAKEVTIHSDKAEDMVPLIFASLGRGITGIESTGMYKGTRRKMLLCVVSPKELPHLMHTIYSVDPAAFVIVTDTHQVFGKGFRSAET